MSVRVGVDAPVIAKRDCEVVDELGVTRRIFAGRPVPGSLLDLYNDTDPKKAKAEVTPEIGSVPDGPEVDKAVKAPEDTKAKPKSSPRRRA